MIVVICKLAADLEAAANRLMRSQDTGIAEVQALRTRKIRRPAGSAFKAVPPHRHGQALLTNSADPTQRHLREVHTVHTEAADAPDIQLGTLQRSRRPLGLCPQV